MTLAMLKKIEPQTRKQMCRFFFAGCGAVGTDTGVYFLLVHNFLAQLGYNWSKFLSFLSGTLVAFIVNKFWTFESKRKSLIEAASFLLLYLLTLGLNVAVNHLVLMTTNNLTIVAFLVATGCSTVANFLGQKYWVFKVDET